MKKFLTLFVLIISPLFLTRCGNEAISSAAFDLLNFESGDVWLEEVNFKVLSDVNENSPVIIDMVIAYNKDLYNQLIALTSSQYFSGKTQFQKDFPQDLEIYSWEAVPGQPLPSKAIHPKRTNGKGVLMFVRYQTPGVHRAQVGNARVIEVKLGRMDFELKKIR